MNEKFETKTNAQTAQDADEQPTTEHVPQFAVVELMGHVRLGGQISEVEFGGSKMIRLDVPQKGGGYATQLIGGASVYRISFCDDITAFAAAQGESTRPPVKEYELVSELESRGITVLKPEPEPALAPPSDQAYVPYDPFTDD